MPFLLLRKNLKSRFLKTMLWCIFPSYSQRLLCVEQSIYKYVRCNVTKAVQTVVEWWWVRTFQLNAIRSSKLAIVVLGLNNVARSSIRKKMLNTNTAKELKLIFDWWRVVLHCLDPNCFCAHLMRLMSWARNFL